MSWSGQVRRMRAAVVVALAATLVVTGCEELDLAEDDPDGSLLVRQGIGRDGKVLMLSPATDSVIQVDRADHSVSAIGVGALPRTLEQPAGADAVYTLEPQDGTLSRIAGDGSVMTIELGGPFNRLEWTPDGTQAVALFDPDLGNVDIAELGSLNPNAIALLTETGAEVTVRQYTLSYPPLEVTFDPSSSKALVSTRARLHVLDLETLEEAAIPFAQGGGVERRPALVVPDLTGERALVGVQGQTDLFIVSLDPVLIENVIGLQRVPSAMAWAGDGATAVILDGTSRVTFLDLSTFDTETLNLPHQATELQIAGGAAEPFALLYSTTSFETQLSRVFLTEPGAPDDVDTWTMEDRIRALEVEPGGTAAVVFHDGTVGAGSVGAESLSLFSFTERAPSRIFLDAPATDLLFLEAGVVPERESPHVLVVLSESARIVRYDLWTYEQVVLDTYARPEQIGVLPAGPATPQQVFVVHAQGGGLVSFMPPTATEVPPGGWPAVAGLTGRGLLDRR